MIVPGDEEGGVGLCRISVVLASIEAQRHKLKVNLFGDPN